MHLPILNIALTLIGGLGIGSLLTTFLKDRFDRKHFKYKALYQIHVGGMINKY